MFFINKVNSIQTEKPYRKIVPGYQNNAFLNQTINTASVPCLAQKQMRSASKYDQIKCTSTELFRYNLCPSTYLK